MLDPKEIVLLILGAPLRHFLTVFGVWLTSHGATADASAAVVSSSFDTIVGLVVIALGIGLSYITKVLAIQRTPPEKK